MVNIFSLSSTNSSHGKHLLFFMATLTYWIRRIKAHFPIVSASKIRRKSYFLNAVPVTPSSTLQWRIFSFLMLHKSKWNDLSLVSYFLNIYLKIYLLTVAYYYIHLQFTVLGWSTSFNLYKTTNNIRKWSFRLRISWVSFARFSFSKSF